MPLNIEIATANTLDPNNCHYPSKGGLSNTPGGYFGLLLTCLRIQVRVWP